MHEFQAHHAKVYTILGPISQPFCAQRTAIANAVFQDSPSEGKLATVFPNFEEEGAAVDSFLPKEQAGRQFDILEFVRSEEDGGASLTEGETETDKDSPPVGQETSEKQ